MVELGQVRSTPRGLLVVSPGQLDPTLFRRGLAVLRGDGSRVGVTYDIIGNVNHPYVIVRLDPGASVRPDERLYVMVPSPPAHRRGRRSRRR